MGDVVAESDVVAVSRGVSDVVEVGNKVAVPRHGIVDSALVVADEPTRQAFSEALGDELPQETQQDSLLDPIVPQKTQTEVGDVVAESDMVAESRGVSDVVAESRGVTAVSNASSPPL